MRTFSRGFARIARCLPHGGAYRPERTCAAVGFFRKPLNSDTLRARPGFFMKPLNSDTLRARLLVLTSVWFCVWLALGVRQRIPGGVSRWACAYRFDLFYT